MNTELEVQSRLYALAVFLNNLRRLIWRKYGPLRIGSILLLTAGILAMTYVTTVILIATRL